MIFPSNPHGVSSISKNFRDEEWAIPYQAIRAFGMHFSDCHVIVEKFNSCLKKKSTISAKEFFKINNIKEFVKFLGLQEAIILQKFTTSAVPK